MMAAAVSRRRAGGISFVALLMAIGGATLGCDTLPAPGRIVPGGDPARGVSALRAHGCGGCHVIPGVAEARGAVGPSLAGLVARTHIAGRLTNTPLNLVVWIRSPRSVDPGTLMPDLGVSEGQARDIAAYLYSVGPHPQESRPVWPPASDGRAVRPR
jgi:cytochrome c